MRNKHLVKQHKFYEDKQYNELELSLAQGLHLEEFELLTLLTRKHLNFSTARNLAKKLITSFENMSGVLNAASEELLQIDGMTRSIILEFKQIQYLVLATTKTNVLKRNVLENHENVITYCKALMRNKKREELHALFLDRKCEIVHHECLQIGTIDHVSIYPRELMLGAMQHSAAYIILAHNHPSGEARPSKADINLTHQLQSIGFVMGVKILDHIIISQKESFSFRKKGMIELSKIGISPDLYSLTSAENSLTSHQNMEGQNHV